MKAEHLNKWDKANPQKIKQNDISAAMTGEGTACGNASDS